MLNKVTELRTKEYAEVLGTNTLTELIVDAYQRKPSHAHSHKDVVSIKIDISGDPFSTYNVGKVNQSVNANIEIAVNGIIEPIHLNGSGEGVIGAINEALKRGVVTNNDDNTDLIDNMTMNYKSEGDYLKGKEDLVATTFPTGPSFTFEEPEE